MISIWDNDFEFDSFELFISTTFLIEKTKFYNATYLWIFIISLDLIQSSIFLLLQSFTSLLAAIETSFLIIIRMLRRNYYKTTKFQLVLALSIIFLCATAGFLYFTITECLQECSHNQRYPSPCIYHGQSFCCASSSLQVPDACAGCIEENKYCTQYVVGSAVSFLLVIIGIIYLCALKKIHDKNVERSTWSGMASMATVHNKSQVTGQKSDYQPPKYNRN